jgi:hypothetical protein
MTDRENIYSDGMDQQGADSQHSGSGEKRGCDTDAWWEDRTLAQKILLGIGFGIIGIGLALLFGWVVMLLWNWLMPEIFGLKQLSYWQAWGLMILSCILFKGIRFPKDESGRRSDRKRRRQLRRYMSEEQQSPGDAPAGTAEAQA